jgi:hypothetical protein
VAYTHANSSNIDEFLVNVEAQAKDAEARYDDLVEKVDRERTRARKRVFENGKVVAKPLFPEASERRWDAFHERLESDLVRRKDRACARGDAGAGEADEPPLRPGEEEQCTFRPLIRTRSRGGGPAEAKDTSDFFARLEEDVKKREEFHAQHKAEDDHCRQWFSRGYDGGLREPHFHENGFPGQRVIPDAKF